MAKKRASAAEQAGKSQPIAETLTGDAWRDHPEIIRQFIEQRADYEQLCSEVAYILRKRLDERGIEVASISFRAKKLSSFLEKLSRKRYQSPFDDVTDFAGVRVVCLYRDHLPAIEEVIREDFEVLEKVDKLSDKKIDQFGYGAIHFIVQLGKRSSGARYDDLRKYACEIQTRTVLQDAWAIVQHHLVYKNETGVPEKVQRKLNSLAGLFETADDQYQEIRQQRDEYLSKVIDASKSNVKKFLDTDLNIDSLRAYLLSRFPDKPVERMNGQLVMVFEDFDKQNYPKLKDIDKVFEDTEAARQKLVMVLDGSLNKVDGVVPSAIEFALAAGLVSRKARESAKMPPNWLAEIQKFVKT